MALKNPETLKYTITQINSNMEFSTNTWYHLAVVCVLIVTRLLFCLNLEFEVNITCNKIPRIYEYPGLIQVSLLNSTC